MAVAQGPEDVELVSDPDGRSEPPAPAAPAAPAAQHLRTRNRLATAAAHLARRHRNPMPAESPPLPSLASALPRSTSHASLLLSSPQVGSGELSRAALDTMVRGVEHLNFILRDTDSPVCLAWVM